MENEPDVSYPCRLEILRWVSAAGGGAAATCARACRDPDEPADAARREGGIVVTDEDASHFNAMFP
jgi:hypothetical protein